MTSNQKRTLKAIQRAQRKLTRLSSRGARKRTTAPSGQRINSLTYRYDARREAEPRTRMAEISVKGYVNRPGTRESVKGTFAVFTLAERQKQKDGTFDQGLLRLH
jgi:hypothetical protein